MKPAEHAIDPQRVSRLSEASDWLLRLQAPEHTEADYQDWLRWCDEDPENFAAFETVQRKWQALDALKAESAASHSSPFALTLTRAQKHALLEQEAQHLIREHRRSVSRYFSFPRQKRARWIIGALAAGITVIGLALAVLHQFLPWLGESREGSQQLTAALINRAATLPDGSRLILGTQSLVSMDFNHSRRALDLTAGEAYFKVKHDKTRPFVVKAGDISVTAIGTAFDVRRGHGKITVTVEEGTVEVRAESGQPTIWRAEAGYQLTYSTKLRTATLASINPSTALAWRNGELAYLYEPLGSVVEDLNRYSARKIVIADPQVAAIPFTGTAFASSLEGWLAGVKQAYPVDVEESATGEVVLSSRK